MEESTFPILKSCLLYSGYFVALSCFFMWPSAKGLSERVVVLCSFLLHAIDPKSEGCSDLKALLRGDFSFGRKWLYGKGGICWWLFIEGNGILFVNMIC